MSQSPELLTIQSVDLSEVRPFLKSAYSISFSLTNLYESHLPLTLLVHLPAGYDPYLKTIEPKCDVVDCILIGNTIVLREYPVQLSNTLKI